MTSAATASVPAPKDYGLSALTFVRRALAIHTMDNVAQEVEATLRETLGVPHAQLVIVGTDGEVRAVGSGAPPRLADADAALGRLLAHPGPVSKAALTDPADKPLQAILSDADADIVIPLRYRGSVIGMVLVGPRNPPPGEAEKEFLQRIGHAASMAVANAHLYGERDKASTGKQVSLANALQDALCPEERPVRRGHMLIRGLFRPALECGGDFWTWEDLGRGKMLIALGDVTGKGVPAAMLAATAKGVACAMRVSRGNELDPRDFLRTLNASIFRAARTQWLMTCFAVVVDVEKGHIAFANAGHNFPYLRTASGELHQLVVRGNTLGAAADCEYVGDERPFSAGDCLLIYSDGVIDATNPTTGETYGEKRLRKFLLQGIKGTPPTPEMLPQQLLAETEKVKTPSGRMIDDITIVVLAHEGMRS